MLYKMQYSWYRILVPDIVILHLVDHLTTWTSLTSWLHPVIFHTLHYGVVLSLVVT